MTRIQFSAMTLLLGALTCPSLSLASLFAGTGNRTVPQGGKNWAYEIEPEVLFAQFRGTGPIDDTQTTNIWGATWDGADTIFFSSPDGNGAAGPLGDATYLWSYSIRAGMSGTCTMGSCYTELGRTTVSGGNDLRMDGLAFSNGTLYAWNQDPTNNAPGLYEISLSDAPVATQVFDSPPVTGFADIKGIDATGGLIYGVDDASQSIVFIDPLRGSFGSLAPYPAGVTDVDGLAAGDGKLYLVGAEAFQEIPTLSLQSLDYLQPTAGVFAFGDDFSGAAFFVPEPTSSWLLLLGLFGSFFHRLRRVVT